MNVSPVKISVVVLIWNGEEYINACLSSILNQKYPHREIIVVDNHSTDASVEKIKLQYPQVKLVESSQNLGFAGGMNLGTRYATGDIVVWLNQDTVVAPDWLSHLVTAFRDDQVGVAGCKIYQPDGRTLHHAGGSIDLATGETYHFGVGEPDIGQYDEAASVEYVTGAALAVRRSVLDQVGLLDERFFPGYYEDADYCLRVRKAGFKILYVPQATLTHFVSTSTKYQWRLRRFYYYRNRFLFLLKHTTLSQEFFLDEEKRLNTLSRDELRAVLFALTDLKIRGESKNYRFYIEQLIEQIKGLQMASKLDLSVLDAAMSENRSNRFSAVGAIIPILAELLDDWKIRDYHFSSSVPLFGPLIATFRAAWNSVGAKWYIKGMFIQQNEVNSMLVQITNLITAYLWDNDNAVMFLEDRYTQLEQRVTDLESTQGVEE